MRTELLSFNSCPVASSFIDTRDDALSYYAHRLIGDHEVVVHGVRLVIRFNAEEIHLFTTAEAPSSPQLAVKRPGASSEVRCFSRDRARRLDDVLKTLRNPAATHVAKIPGGRLVYGPADANSMRYAVIVAPDRGVWFVRTAYGVTAQAFRQALGSGRAVRWPPK